jgi:hypothetical protein
MAALRQLSKHIWARGMRTMGRHARTGTAQCLARTLPRPACATQVSEPPGAQVPRTRRHAMPTQHQPGTAARARPGNPLHRQGSQPPRRHPSRSHRQPRRRASPNSTTLTRIGFTGSCCRFWTATPAGDSPLWATPTDAPSTASAAAKRHDPNSATPSLRSQSGPL